MRLFMRWLNLQPGWVGVDARSLLLRQVDSEDPYELLDLLQKFVSGLDRTRKGKQIVYTAVRSFFTHSRCALPEDRGFKVRSTRLGIVPKLTVSHIVDAVKGANLRDRSILLVKWQGMLDNERLVYVGRNLSDQVVTQIKSKVHPVRIDLAGRKNNEQGFYTFIGRDATDALTAYFEKERGWPKPDEAIWLQKSWNGKARTFTTTGLVHMWLRLLRRIGLLPKKRGPKNARYGYNLHEMRDIAKSLLHTHAKPEGFDMDCAEFMLGHIVDPLGYDKFYNDQEYMRKQYLTAEKHLNIVSGGGASTPSREELKRQEQEILTMKGEVARLIQLVQELQQQIEKEGAGPQ